MKTTLDTQEVLAAIQDYRDELKEEARSRPGDFRLQHKIHAVDGVSARVKLLARGSMRVIQGGKNNKEDNS